MNRINRHGLLVQATSLFKPVPVRTWLILVAAVLAFSAAKMLISSGYQVPVQASLAIVTGLLGARLMARFIATRRAH